MGLIADALRKAEQERLTREQSQTNGCQPNEVLPVPPNELVDVPPALREHLSSIEPTKEIQSEVPPIAAGPDTPNELLPNPEYIVDESIVVYHDKCSELTEQYRALRARITAQNSTGENQILAITSSIPREGKSVTTMNLSWVMSEIRHFKVLMIDGDFRRSSLAKMMNVPEYPGLADLLRDECRLSDVIRPTPLPNLHIITAGTTQGFNAAELLSSQKIGNVFSECRRRYQYTFVDTPPASTVSDASVLASWCNGVLFVVRMGRTPEPVAQATLRALQANNVHILGCVAAGRCHRTGTYGRYYGYYRYYKDYYHYYHK